MKQTQINLNFPTNWNLKLLYESPQDPQIEKDLKMYDEKRKKFAEKYENRTDYLQDEDKLLTALKEYEQLLSDLNGARPLMYFHYLTSLESNNERAQAQLNRITTQLTKAQNRLAFFPIKLGKIDPAFQDKFLSSQKLKKYHYLLQRRFLLAQYDLKEEQEKIINLMDQPSHQMWVKGVEKALNNKTVEYKGQKLPLSKASQNISELPTKDRRNLHTKLLTKCSEVQDFAETELNAIITYKQIEDELRGYQLPYEATVLSTENNLETVETLVETVTKAFDLSHQFYQLKAQLLELEELSYADRAAKIGSFDRKYEFDQAYNLTYETFQNLDPEFSQILERMAANGQLDIFPKKGKVAGAFCSSSINNPSFILLNHTNDFNSVLTLAHEMGHAIHSELSKSQPVIYQSYSTSTAETASTFFEQFVFERLIQDFSQKERVIALHNQLQQDINTVFRQIALFNFELDLHNQIQEKGYLSAHRIAQLLNKHMQTYLGPLFKLNDLDGKSFIIWPHIRYFFYTYTYAFGHLVSKALVNQVKQKPQNIQKVKQFLAAGGSDTPQHILQAMDIDISQSNFFTQGLKVVKEDLEKLKMLIN
jgi:oligoendopeptidase F